MNNLLIFGFSIEDKKMKKLFMSLCSICVLSAANGFGFTASESKQAEIMLNAIIPSKVEFTVTSANIEDLVSGNEEQNSTTFHLNCNTGTAKISVKDQPFILKNIVDEEKTLQYKVKAESNNYEDEIDIAPGMDIDGIQGNGDITFKFRLEDVDSHTNITAGTYQGSFVVTVIAEAEEGIHSISSPNITPPDSSGVPSPTGVSPSSAQS